MPQALSKPVVLVTGASGFVGLALCRALAERGYAVLAAVRSITSVADQQIAGVRWIEVGDLSRHPDWSACLAQLMSIEGKTHCVVHCAARAHVMHETETDALSAYRAVNVTATEQLARQAAEVGVNRLVFLSSIKVNGERTAAGQLFRHNDPPKPEDSYGLTKLEAEQALWTVGQQTSLEITVVRAPLVYGPHVKGNLARLLALVGRGLPLPLASIKNQRSMVSLTNLVDLLICCTNHPKAHGQTLLVCDEQSLSTPQLVSHLALALGVKSRLFSMPVGLLQLAARLLGKQGEVARLTESLLVDGLHVQSVLGWRPPASTTDEIKAMVATYQASVDKG